MSACIGEMHDCNTCPQQRMKQRHVSFSASPFTDKGVLASLQRSTALHAGDGQHLTCCHGMVFEE